MTSTPSRARCRAVLRPMPRLPPVMRAILVMATIVGPRRPHQRSLQPGTSCPWLRARRGAIMEGMDRDGLADFLRRRRAALQPEDVGLGPGRRRRTPGLRREEVAALAHMSTDFYTRLEQGRGLAPVGGDARLDRPRAAADARRARPPAPARRPRAAAARAPQRPRHARAAARARPPRHARPGGLRPRRDARPEPDGGGAARRPDRVHRARAQHVLPLVHRPGGARALARRRTTSCTRAATRRPARRPRSERGARAGRRAAARQPGVRPRCGTSTRSRLPGDDAQAGRCIPRSACSSSTARSSPPRTRSERLVVFTAAPGHRGRGAAGDARRSSAARPLSQMRGSCVRKDRWPGRTSSSWRRRAAGTRRRSVSCSPATGRWCSPISCGAPSARTRRICWPRRSLPRSSPSTTDEARVAGPPRRGC